MSYLDLPINFDSEGERLLGIVSRPLRPASIGVLVIVGGPQYRIGSHRQFVLLARCLASAGYAVMRFDSRGMGDSGGEPRGFEDSGNDIAAAIDAFQAACPEINSVVLWGLCDAASAALLYWGLQRDSRVKGLCLLNPWVRAEATLARTRVKHYYRQRFLQRDFWVKLVRGRMNLAGSLKDLLRNVQLSAAKPVSLDDSLSFKQRMAAALQHFPGNVLLILSGDDYTAREFIECTQSDPAWAGALKNPSLSRHDVAGADHTFSSKLWRDEVEQTTLGWLRKLWVSA